MKYIIMLALLVSNVKVFGMPNIKSQTPIKSGYTFVKHLQGDINELVTAWQTFITSTNWNDLIKDVTPIKSGCGTIYELPNFLNRSNEDFAIVVMREISYSEPHYHPTGNYEIYFILAGTAIVVVGENEHAVKAGDVIVVEPNMAHFTIPDKHYVIAVVCTPPYVPENYIPLKESNPLVKFNREQFDKLIIS